MTDSPKLTARQQQILELVQHAIARTGAPPTRAEIAAQLGFKSANAAEEHLQALARKGVIELVGGTSRGIRLPSASLREVNEARSQRGFSLPLPGFALPGGVQEIALGAVMIVILMFRPTGIMGNKDLTLALPGSEKAGRQGPEPQTTNKE